MREYMFCANYGEERVFAGERRFSSPHPCVRIKGKSGFAGKDVYIRVFDSIHETTFLPRNGFVRVCRWDPLLVAGGILGHRGWHGIGTIHYNVSVKTLSEVLGCLRAQALGTQAHIGAAFEVLVRNLLTQVAPWRGHFRRVWLWGEA